MKANQLITFLNSGLNSDDSLEVMPVGDSPTTFASIGRQNVIIPPDNYGKLEDAWGTTLVAAGDTTDNMQYMGHAVDTDGEWCYYFLAGVGASLNANSIIGINLRDATTVRSVLLHELELEFDTSIIFKKASYIDGWVYWASGQYGPKKVHIERAMNFTTYKNSAWENDATYDTDDIVLYTDGGVYKCLDDTVTGTAPPEDDTNWELYLYAYPNTAVAGDASLIDGAFDLVNFPPTEAITGAYDSSVSRLYNNLRGKTFQFTYRWKLLDGGFTDTAPFSELFLSPDVEGYDGEILNSFSLNNVLSLTLDGGLVAQVEYVELFVRTSEETSWQYVDKIDAGVNAYDFYNDYLMEVVSDDMVGKLDNYIPRETRALELLSENVIALGGNKYGFNNVTPDVGLTVGWENITLNAAGGVSYTAVIGAEVVEYIEDHEIVYDEIHYNKVTLNDAITSGVVEGDILRVVLYYASFTLLLDYLVTAADEADVTVLRDSLITLINSESAGVTAAYTSPPSGISLTSGDFYLMAYGMGESLNELTSSIVFYSPSVELASNKKSQFTTGARHVFGLTYFDRAMRPFAVAAGSTTEVYVPTVVGAKGSGETYDWKNYIDWEIKHEAPAEAKYWQWFYAGNQNIDDFWFYVIDSAAMAAASTTVLEIDITPLQEVQATYPLSQVGPYEWQPGDRLRAITKTASAGAYGELVDADIDVEIKSYDETTNVITVATSGSDTYDLGEKSLIQIYRPKIAPNDDIFFAFGPIYDTYTFSGNVYHRGALQDQTGETAGTGATGRWNKGDSYIIARAFDVAVSTAAVGTFFLVESPAYSDFYDSNWYSKGKVNIRSNIGEVELNNIAISNKLIQDTGINGLSTFEYDDIVSLPDKNGKINAMRQIGNVLRVIQQRKRTSFYVGMTEFYNQDGTSSLVASDQILGNARELDGDWGTEHPETVVKINDMLFFFDLHNRAFVQDSENGAVAISDNKMRQFFMDLGDAVVTAISDGDDYYFACDYEPKTQTLYFYYYIEDIGAKILLYHLPSKRWISALTGLPATSSNDDFATETTTETIIYGYLYNWYAATNDKNIASDGWSVPANDEVNTLQTYLGGLDSDGYKLKETGYTYWNTPNTGATNETNFNGRGSGIRSGLTGSFSSKLIQGYIATTDYGSVEETSWRYRGLYYNQIYIGSFQGSFASGISIRLIKDTTTLTDGETGTYTGNDGHVYNTICIGTQEWLSENLIETKYRDGTAIPEVTSAASWMALTTGARCSYDSDEDNAFTATGTVNYNLRGLIGAENRFFMLFDGDLYLMDSSADRREFVGNTTKAEAFIKVVGNQEPLIPKIIDTVGVVSNQHTGWTVDSVVIPADQSTMVDQVSVAMDADWRTREGITRAPVKRNAYTSGVYAYKDLWEGEKMRGRVCTVEFTLPEQTSGNVDVVALEVGMSK